MASGKNENIRVVVRIRPENQNEIDGNCQNIVKPVDHEILVFDPDLSGGSSEQWVPNCHKRKARDVHFHFDHVFDEKAQQNDVFKETTLHTLDGVFNGFNCSVLAYGATGAGKTHTMLGSQEQPGLIFLTMMELYRRIEEIKSEKACEISVSYLEVCVRACVDMQ